jgi:hypothetical protein
VHGSEAMNQERCQKRLKICAIGRTVKGKKVKILSLFSMDSATDQLRCYETEGDAISAIAKGEPGSGPAGKPSDIWQSVFRGSKCARPFKINF